MSKNILILNGHPDPSPERLCAGLAAAYANAASLAGHGVRRIDVGALDFPMIRSQAEFVAGEPPPAIREAQEAVRWADHVAIFYPLWQGGPPAVLKGFIEQVMRYGVALSPPGEPVKGLLAGRSARLFVTMGMPGFAFRLVFGSHGVKCLSKGVLWISGFRPVRDTVFGNVEGVSPAKRREWLDAVARLGAAAA